MLHLYVQGHYMCIVSSAPQYPGQRARLISPIFPQTIGSCLTFYYYMCDFRMGMLVVYLAEMGPFTPYQVMFQKSGNQVDTSISKLLCSLFQTFNV